MVITREKVIKSLNYLFAILSGAGLLFFIMSIFMLLSSEVDDMYEFTEGIAVFFWWLILFSVATLLIDFIVYKFLSKNKTVKIGLYVVAGYLFFIINPMDVWMLFIGIMGAISSLIIYFGSSYSFYSKSFKYVFSIVIPLTLCILININFTEKEGWEEVRTSSSYEATFDYFNGKEEIPIELRRGDTLTLSFSFVNEKGGWSFHVLNKFGQTVSRKKVDEEHTKFTAQLNGDYRYVVIGDDLKGSFKINWSIDESN